MEVEIRKIQRRKKKKKRKNPIVTKVTLVNSNLHTAQCSYNIYSVGWLKSHCHKTPNIRNFNYVAKCVKKVEHGEKIKNI
jgi:sensor domain CHASE-containing protein